MRLQVHAIHFDADSKLLEFIEKKLGKLETFYDRITSGEVYLRLDKSESSKVKNKVVEVKINVPNAELFVKESGRSFEEGTDLALEALKIQIKKYKAKRQDVENRTIKDATTNGAEVAEEIEIEEI
ncbi:HPF/RaiA family ribosome-associated protein [Runella slithyformis]|uniref:Ribosomal subunit interface protein n=1 Tax=Runella slithyformis (strain ATCC 29530 / DSM 19594 / LMG 11500 / NCIMB 11436 / LSU 4) TaxID=761193 RepID=A0A7U3ZK43_RUNSL|nr:HPF/RaiA family ribosome-associated protein [Runella slithyformis]AEI48707.1 ribosomal subunit interface protein [Runella slithyformis DSM 19594]